MTIARIDKKAQATDSAFAFGSTLSEQTNPSLAPGSEGALPNKHRCFEFVACKLSSEKNIDFIFEHLERGQYVVLVEPIWFFDVNHRFNFSVSSPGKSELVPFSKVPLETAAAVESLVWSDYVARNPQEISQRTQGTCLENEVTRAITFKDELGLELVSFWQSSSEQTLLQNFTVETEGLALLENVQDFTAKSRFRMEVEIPPEEVVTKAFKVDLKKKIIKGDCGPFSNSSRGVRRLQTGEPGRNSKPVRRAKGDPGEVPFRENARVSGQRQEKGGRRAPRNGHQRPRHAPLADQRPL